MQHDAVELFKDNVKLMYHFLWKLHLAQDDAAITVAYEALIKAANDYDPTKGTKFSTFAGVCIYNALGLYVRKLKSKSYPVIVSYNAMLENETENSSSNNTEHISLLASDSSVEEDYMHRALCRLTAETVDKQLNKLKDGPKKEILVAWRESEYTAKTIELAELCGVSQSYVSRIIQNFKAVLKKELQEDYYA